MEINAIEKNINSLVLRNDEETQKLITDTNEFIELLKQNIINNIKKNIIKKEIKSYEILYHDGKIPYDYNVLLQYCNSNVLQTMMNELDKRKKDTPENIEKRKREARYEYIKQDKYLKTIQKQIFDLENENKRLRLENNKLQHKIKTPHFVSEMAYLREIKKKYDVLTQ